MSPDEVEPQTVALWTAEIDRRAREVADGKVVLVDADEVHAEGRQASSRAGQSVKVR